jgi:hypothetical protein
MRLLTLPIRGRVHDQGRPRPALAVVSAVAAAAALAASSDVAVAQSEMEKQDQCELSYIRDTRSPMAILYIRSACNWLALNGDSFLNDRR